MNEDDIWLQELKLGVLDDYSASLRKNRHRAWMVLLCITALALLWLSTGPDPSATIVQFNLWMTAVCLAMPASFCFFATFKLWRLSKERDLTLRKLSVKE